MSNKTHFEFDIGDAATVTISAEHGTVDVRYVQANGCAALKWFPASELSKA